LLVFGLKKQEELTNLHPETTRDNRKHGVNQIQKNTQHVDLRRELRQNTQAKEHVYMREETKHLQC